MAKSDSNTMMTTKHLMRFFSCLAQENWLDV
jgi:hypothetical protein